SSHTLGTEDDDISVLNGQVDVDSGTGTSTYWLKVNISDYDGLSTLDQLNAYLWYDDNSIGAASTYPPGASNNTHVHFHLDLSTDWWDIAILGNGEFTMVQNETVGINSTTQIVYLKFIMGSQIRYAGGSFTESPKGTPAADQSDRTKGLNDPDTWDMEVNLTDTHSGYANAYDEFGTYRFSMLTSSGTPGTQTGVGPPNNPVALSPTGNITFSANCPYRLNVTVTNLTGVNNPSNQINANVIGIKGGDLSGTGYLSTSNFTDENTPQTLLGTPIGWENPNNDSTNTNTSNAGGGTSVGTVVWVCHTPNAPADTYVGTAKYTLLHP
ncbi:MAG: hypothetical protein KAT70_06140, partial [Thermoplasmata archaeon]|nr:hypothetical protein [Thermoplasmata archaeon]